MTEKNVKVFPSYKVVEMYLLHLEKIQRAMPARDETLGIILYYDCIGKYIHICPEVALLCGHLWRSSSHRFPLVRGNCNTI